MPQTPTAGYGTYANYGYEAVYGTGVAGTRTFGQGVKLTYAQRNNMERIHSLGFRNAQTISALKFEGSATVEFTLSNASWIRGVLGDVTDAGAGPYTHTYLETNALPSFTIATGSELGTLDEVTTLLGCMINTATLTASVGELTRVRIECPYKTATLATTGIGSQVAETEEVFNFAQGSVELPNGTPLACVQSFEITMNNNLEAIYCLGSRFLGAQVPKIRQYDIRMTLIFDDPSVLLEKFYGSSSGPTNNTPSPTATLQLTFTNGLSGTNERTIELNFGQIYINEDTLPKDVNEIIKEDVSAYALSCSSVIWTNNTAVDDGSP